MRRGYHSAFRFPKEGMDKPDSYHWQTPYVFAILELNPARLPSKIDEALRAIKERLGTP